MRTSVQSGADIGAVAPASVLKREHRKIIKRERRLRFLEREQRVQEEIAFKGHQVLDRELDWRLMRD